MPRYPLVFTTFQRHWRRRRTSWASAACAGRIQQTYHRGVISATTDTLQLPFQMADRRITHGRKTDVRCLTQLLLVVVVRLALCVFLTAVNIQRC